MIFILIACNENVINNDPSDRRGKIIGIVYDSLSLTPLNPTELKISYNNSKTLTDLYGYFVFQDIPFGTHNLSISSIGYTNRDIEITVNDSLLELDEIMLTRNKYFYDVITYDDLPDLIHPDSNYYRLSSYSFPPPRRKHHWNSPDWDSIFVNNFIDSLIIGIKRLNIEIDTLWYQSYEPQCSDPLVSWYPEIAVKLKEPNYRMYTLTFESPESNPQAIFLFWHYCQQKPMHYRKYYLFE